MNQKTNPRGILEQISTIQRMERGKLSVIRQGPSGPYFNLQHRESGRNVTEYVPAEQVAQVQENIESYNRFETLVNEYGDILTEQSRQERKSGVKKKRSPQTSASPKTPKSKT